MSEITWLEIAQAEAGEVEYPKYPMFAAAMAQAEQQKRTADALEQIVLLLEHATVKFAGGQERKEEK